MVTIPKLSPSDLAAVYRACERPTHVFLSTILWGRLDELYGFNFYPWFDESSENERIMALLFFATIMQEGGL